MTSKHFSEVSKETLKGYQEKSLYARRSMYLRAAWAKQDQIKAQRTAGVEAKELAKLYNVNIRQIYRIVAK